MGWTIFWIILILGGSWGILLSAAEQFENNVCQPIYDRITAGGRKTIWQFLIYSLIFSCITRALTRAPLWLFFYWAMTYLGADKLTAYKFVGVLIFAAGFVRASELVRDNYPPEPKNDTLTRWLNSKKTTNDV